MSKHSILRIGPIIGTTKNECNATKLRNAILGHFRDECGDGNNNNDNLLTISNRYFDATVLLLGLHESHTSDHRRRDDVESTNGTISPPPPPEEDGVLLVFDDGIMPPSRSRDINPHNGTSAITFDSLDRMHDDFASNARSAGGTVVVGDLLRLCIGIVASSSSDDDDDDDDANDGIVVDEAEYSRRVLWCIDRGYEYVTVNASDIGTSSGFDVRDKEGYARIIEALETCMWSNRVMRRTTGGRGGGMVGGVGGDDRTEGGNRCGDDENEDRDIVARGGGDVNPMQRTVAMTMRTTSITTSTMMEACANATTNSEREMEAMASMMNGADHIEGDLNSHPSSSSTMHRRDDDVDDDDEVAFHQLERILTEARCVREASRDDKHMSDEERRDRAGDVAMKLMGLLDRLGFDDDDDDDDDEDDNDDDVER